MFLDIFPTFRDGSDKIRPTIDYEEHSAYLSDASGTANGDAPPFAISLDAFFGIMLCTGITIWAAFLHHEAWPFVKSGNFQACIATGGVMLSHSAKFSGGMEVSEGIASILMSSLLMRGAADADSLVKHLGEEEAFQEAVAVCKEKAEGGDARYALIYAVLLQEGHGVAQDLEGAFKFFKIAADKGSKEGINNVGTCLEKGVGVAQDIMAAHKWYAPSLAPSRGTQQFHTEARARSNSFALQHILLVESFWHM